MQRFCGKSVLVTGAASGIGRAAAERIASEGGAVFCADLDSAGIDEVVAGIVAAGGRATAFSFDIGDEGQVEACISTCVSRQGKLDVVVNMAGILHFDNLHEMALDRFEQIVRVNLTGTFLLCRAALPHLIESGGNIVNAASTSSLKGLPWGAAYGASKGGVLSLTRTIAVEYGKRGVRANAVVPGDIVTGIVSGLSFPEDADLSLIERIRSLSGAREPSVVAGAIAMLASEDGAHINGEYVRVDGGTLA